AGPCEFPHRSARAAPPMRRPVALFRAESQTMPAKNQSDPLDSAAVLPAPGAAAPALMQLQTFLLPVHGAACRSPFSAPGAATAEDPDDGFPRPAHTKIQL